jgi:hypothetical protein
MSLVDVLEEITNENLEDHVYEIFVTRDTDNTQGLGILSRNNTVELTIGDHDLEITQSISLLQSNSESSTTGAVAWRVSPLLAEWLLDPTSVFHKLVQPHATIVELGAGVAGILGSILGGKVRQYIATDQEHLLKLLRQNISNNVQIEKKTTPNIKVCEYDWEFLETIKNFDSDIEGVNSNGVIIACDTIYNDFLIPHFVNALRKVAVTMGSGAHIFIAQQLRSSEVLEACFAKLLHSGFSIWAVDDTQLSESLRKGFAVHYLALNQENK